MASIGTYEIFKRSLQLVEVRKQKNKKNRLVHIGHASWAECELCSNYETGTFTSRLALPSYIDCMHLTVCLVLGGELMTL